MKDNCIVYRHVRLDTNEVFYVGIGGNEKRAYVTGRRSKWWNKITDKTEYRVDILFDDMSWDETKLKMSKAQKGRTVSVETRDKISKSNTGKASHKKGVRPSDKEVARLQELNNKRKKPVLQLDLNGKLIKIWESALQAKREGGYHQGHVNACCLGNSKTHKGFIWTYQDNDNNNTSPNIYL